MSAHVDAIIADMTAKRDALSEMIAKLEWFKVEFPHTAASFVASSNGTSTNTARRPTKRAAPVTREKRSASSKAPAAVDQELQEIGDRIVTALRAKSPQRTGDLIKAAKLKVERNKLGRLLVMLAATGRITRSGAGRGATLSLPGKTQARGNL